MSCDKCTVPGCERVTKLIKTDSEILNLVLKSIYVNETWHDDFGFFRIENPMPDEE